MYILVSMYSWAVGMAVNPIIPYINLPNFVFDCFPIVSFLRGLGKDWRLISTGIFPGISLRFEHCIVLGLEQTPTTAPLGPIEPPINFRQQRQKLKKCWKATACQTRPTSLLTLSRRKMEVSWEEVAADPADKWKIPRRHASPQGTACTCSLASI